MSMDTEYPSKVRTVEGELNLQKDSDIWVSDGNVILTAKGPSEVLHGFKCHKSTLAKNSEVFSTMFPLTQPEDADEYEGLPVVHLTDTPEDVKALLMMLYDPMKCIPQFRLVAYDWTDDLSAVFAPLRLSHKYELDEVHRRLSAFLQQRWPSQLSTWLKVSEHYRISAEPGSYTASPTRSREHLVRSVGEHFHWTQVGPNIDSDGRTPAEVIVLAETTDVPAILPAAYYNLRLWMHDSRPLADATGAQCAEWDLGSCLESLSSYQFFRIVQLNEWLKRVESEVIRKELAHRLIAPCNVASCCNARRAFWKEELAGLMRAGNQLYRDPLRGLDTLNKGIVKRVQGHTPPAIESACSIRMLQEVAAVAKYIWEEMPFVLGIKPRVVDDIYGYQRFFQAVVV